MILVACGLLREARLIARPGVVAVAGGGDAARLERELDARASEARAILSVGLCGALAPGLAPGDWVVDGDPAPFVVPAGARAGRIAGSPVPVATAAAKAALHAATDALAVDMESHVAAAVAARRAVRFAALRVVSDAATFDLPPAALVGMRADGGMDVGAVLVALARRPGQVPTLMRTARGAGTAFAALGRLRLAR